MLRELYGPGVERVRVDQKAFKVNSKTVDVTTVGSNYHVELNPSDAGLSDRLIVQEVIKDMAQTQTIDPSTQRSFKVPARRIPLHALSRVLTHPRLVAGRGSSRSGSAHEGRPACSASNDGEVHVDMPPGARMRELVPRYRAPAEPLFDDPHPRSIGR